MTSRFLLDISVLLGLFDEEHQFFSAAHAWVDRLDRLVWASCPLTQNGFVRIFSQPTYANALSATEVLRRLSLAIERTDHEFWPDDLSITDDKIFQRKHLIGHRQITDAYLLALAVRHGGRLVTLDRGMPIDAVVGARAEHVVLLGG